MSSRYSLFLLISLVALAGAVRLQAAPAPPPATPAPEMPVEDAWKALPKYEPGQDMAPLLAMDQAVIRAMASPETRSACAARLAGVLEAAETTPAARQYICLQLRQIGTVAQVPLLAKLLAKPETSEMARHALEAIPGDASVAAIRDSLGTLRGPLLVGAINSVGARRDARSVAKLQSLAGSEDRQIASAAIGALGNIGNQEVAAFLSGQADRSGLPTPQPLAVALLQCAAAFSAAGSNQQAQAIYTRLSQAGQAAGIRRAALEGLLRLQGPQREATILAWFGGKDADQRLIAAGHLASLPEERLDQLASQLGQLPDAAKFALLEILASRKGKSVLPTILEAAKSDKPEIRVAGLRCLGLLADSSTIPVFLDALAAGGESAEAAQDALGRLPRKEVAAALLEALTSRPEARASMIEVLKRLRCYEAIPPLVAIAAQDDPAGYGPALDGLRGIADPDKSDIPRLVGLLLKTAPGRHRDEVERTIVIVCDKLPAGADHAELVLAALAKVKASEAPKYLPVLGRLGGPKALKRIEAALGDADPEVKQAAVRGLCNWPTAEVADKLWELATKSDNESFRRWALRAYVRVIGLKSDRPEAKSLAMLQQAMKLAANAEDKQLILSRASTVRTLEAVDWIAGYLDDPAVAQAACLAIVELAHHRFLRHPNMDRFGPLLDKVGKISKDADVVERAKKYRLGL